MKKVGIITLNGYFNFGNRLQNYALTKILEEKGYEVYTIWNKNYNTIVKDFIKSKLFFVKKYKRYGKFYKFSKKNMKEVINKRSIIQDFDAFVVGSDQVWNYKLMDKDNTWFEAPENKKTISYAASFGTSEFPEDFKDKICNQLEKYDAISVREISGKNFLDKNLSSKKAELVVDPTLLLDSTLWNDVIKKPKCKIPKKYIFVYFLGEISNEYKIEIKKFADKNSCEIINILDEKSDFFTSGPEEFLYLIKNAYLICTDSFHASVFSFKFNKPFVIFKRSGDGISNDLYTRLENFINVFDIRNREYNGIEITKENLECNYSNSYSLLENEISKSIKFINDNLKM